MNTLSDSTQSRREFLVATAAAGIALSVRPVCAQTMIVTPSDGLGSGNILMEPNDRYLCIVADRGGSSTRGGEPIFPPFEGDGTLALILSKAFLLADDDRIKDRSILSQIGRG